MIVAAALCSMPAFAQLTAELQKNSLPIVWRDNDVSGPGADLLDRELATTQFFLIGEDHGSAESANVASALLRRGRQHGYRHLAMEVGSITIERLLADPKSVPAMAKRYPWAFSFLQWKEEVDLFETAVNLHDSVWGLDQEFVLSPEFHLERLRSVAKSEEARRTVDSLLERVRTGDREMVAKHNPMAIFFASATAADFAALRKAFPNNRTVDELEESWKIYNLNFHGEYWQNNFDRSLMMRRHFREHYDAAVAAGERHPKVLLKFGASHMMRGRSIAGVYDLGTYLPEIGQGSFQLLIVFGGGFVNAHRPFSLNDDDRRAPYHVKYENVDLAPVAAAATGSDWLLVDLRPMRPLLAANKLGTIAPPLLSVLWGFDAILIIPEASPATLIE